MDVFKNGRTWLVASLLLWSCCAAQAARLDNVQGPVLVNHGDGYKPVATAMQLKGGDSVMANPGGSARITNPNGDIIVVKPGMVVVVADDKDPKTTGGIKPSALNQSLVAEAEEVEKEQRVDPATHGGTNNVLSTNVITGVVFIGGVIGLGKAIQDTLASKNSPSSP